MKEEFKAFYNATDDELQEIWNSENTLFVFDTNVLLHLYGYAEETRKDFFKIIDRLKDSIWIPYHVGLEYQRRRLDIIKNEKKTFIEIEKNLEKIQSIFKKDFESLALKRRFPKLAKNTEKLETEIKNAVSHYKKSVTHWDTVQPDVRSEDKIRERIDAFFENKVGEKPENQEWLDAIYTEGEARFEKKIPPGFADANKSKDPNEASFTFNGLNYDRQYGDLILWKQLIEKAKKDNIHNIIFITDDTKNDWWQKIGSSGEKAIGPLPELSAEMYRESSTEKFYMYTTSSFMKSGEDILEIKLDEGSIVDVSIQNKKDEMPENFFLEELQSYEVSDAALDGNNYTDRFYVINDQIIKLKKNIYNEEKKLRSAVNNNDYNEIESKINELQNRRLELIFERVDYEGEIDKPKITNIQRKDELRALMERVRAQNKRGND
jgi:hypothetical protein